MPMSALTGTRLRERRLALGLRQGDIARAAGISASYLNLIEHNRRRVGADVLAALAGALDVPAAELVEGASGALVDDLRAAAAAVEMPGAVRAEVDRVDEFAGRFPGWAGVVGTLNRRAAALERSVTALNDRMGHDPHLSASIHEVLSALASVRSTAGILAETEDIDPDWRARFHRNLHEDSERMAAGAEALVAWLDRSGDTPADTGLAAPQDEFEAWLAARDWALPELDAGRPEIPRAEVARLASGAARALAGAWLARAEADAAALPMALLLAVAGSGLPDPLRIAQAVGVPADLVFRRLALVPGRGYGLVICDASGTLTFRRPAEGFALPRFGSACPLWPLYVALGHAGRAVVADLAIAGRPARRFRALAYATLRHPQGFGGVELREAAMLVAPVPMARTAGQSGGQSADPSAGPSAGQTAGRSADEPLVVGSSCRICPKPDCPARREASIVAAA